MKNLKLKLLKGICLLAALFIHTSNFAYQYTQDTLKLIIPKEACDYGDISKCKIFSHDSGYFFINYKRCIEQDTLVLYKVSNDTNIKHEVIKACIRKNTPSEIKESTIKKIDFYNGKLVLFQSTYMITYYIGNKDANMIAYDSPEFLRNACIISDSHAVITTEPSASLNKENTVLFFMLNIMNGKFSLKKQMNDFHRIKQYSTTGFDNELFSDNNNHCYYLSKSENKIYRIYMANQSIHVETTTIPIENWKQLNYDTADLMIDSYKGTQKEISGFSQYVWDNSGFREGGFNADNKVVLKVNMGNRGFQVVSTDIQNLDVISSRCSVRSMAISSYEEYLAFTEKEQECFKIIINRFQKIGNHLYGVINIEPISPDGYGDLIIHLIKF